MFYLKYRPRTICEIDNSNIREQIKNILEFSNLPHAFLFVGQKGTGKTSLARIFAKAINCQENKFSSRGNSIEPCNKCRNCLNIDSSASPDVLEMDAASNRGIDEIRNLIKESAFAPMSGRFRVFIIDEAHMITHDAFNALLKTLEEPPQSVIFILATTNLEKVPKTIISRCILLNFGKAGKKDIIGMLNRIIKNEKVTIDKALIDLIVKYSENSFRDATKILEELVIQNKLSYEEGKKILGSKNQKNLIEIIEKKDLKLALEWVDQFAQNDGDIKSLITGMLEDLRLILLTKNGIKVEGEIESSLTTLQTAKLMKFLTQAYENLRNSPISSIPLEVALVEFYNEMK